MRVETPPYAPRVHIGGNGIVPLRLLLYPIFPNPDTTAPASLPLLLDLPLYSATYRHPLRPHQYGFPTPLDLRILARQSLGGNLRIPTQ